MLCMPGNKTGVYFYLSMAHILAKSIAAELNYILNTLISGIFEVVEHELAFIKVNN